MLASTKFGAYHLYTSNYFFTRIAKKNNSYMPNAWVHLIFKWTLVWCGSGETVRGGNFKKVEFSKGVTFQRCIFLKEIDCSGNIAGELSVGTSNHNTVGRSEPSVSCTVHCYQRATFGVAWDVLSGKKVRLPPWKYIITCVNARF